MDGPDGLTADSQEDVVVSGYQHTAGQSQIVLFGCQVHHFTTAVHQVHTICRKNLVAFRICIRTIENDPAFQSSTFGVHTSPLFQMIEEVYQLTVEIEHFHPALCQEVMHMHSQKIWNKCCKVQKKKKKNLHCLQTFKPACTVLTCPETLLTSKQDIHKHF